MPLAELRALDFAGIVLSPGPAPAAAGNLLAVIASTTSAGRC
ncbi:MAG: hypothetical protein WKG07_23710 [Hymenobacter sp.]